jgi:tetratricopeptide (TPR) repeat protein
MTMNDAGREEIGRFVRGELTPVGNRRMVRQLLQAYGRPPRPVGETDERSKQPQPVTPLPAATDRWEQRSLELQERATALAEEREAAPRLRQRLRALAPEERRATLALQRVFHSWALCELLIEESQERLYDNVPEAKEMAELALTLTAKLDTAFYGRGLANDLHARALAALGEVRRVSSDLRSAEEALAKAEVLIGMGTGDALEEASILERKAALRCTQQQTGEALRLLEDVISIYRQYRDFHLVGRAYVGKGRVLAETGDLTAAIYWLQKGLALLDAARDRRFAISAKYSLMLLYHESGRHPEAWFLLRDSRPEFQAGGGQLLNLRLCWLEGKLQQACNFPEEAQASYHTARNGFIAHGVGFDAALVSLDLAGLYSQLGRGEEMAQLAEEMMPIFQSRDLHREAIAALIVFQQSVRMATVNTELLQEITRYLQKARYDYKLRFETWA